MQLVFSSTLALLVCWGDVGLQLKILSMIKKYILSALAISVLVVQSGSVAFAVLRNVPSVSGEVFTDVGQDYGAEYSNALFYLKGEGIVSGYADGSFKPYEKINRAEFTKIIVGASRAANNNGLCIETFARQDGSYADMFNDVITVKSPWYLDYVCYAKTEHLIDGYTDGSFKPGQNINFVEASKILANAFKLNPQTSSQQPWYKGYVEVLASKKAIPTSINRFDQEITRGEMAEMVYRLKTNNTSLPSLSYDSLLPFTLYSSAKYGFALTVSQPCRDVFVIQEVPSDGGEAAKFLVNVPETTEWTDPGLWYEYMVWSRAKYNSLQGDEGFGMLDLLRLKNNMLLVEGLPQDLPKHIQSCRIFESVI